MWKIIINKIFGIHFWELIVKTPLDIYGDKYNTQLIETYTVHIYICKECGKFKKIKTT